MNRLLASILTALLALLAAPGAHATSVVLLDLETHLSESSAVVEAIVGSQETSINFESNKPVTDTTLQIVDVVYGDAPSEVSVRQLKGKVGNIELHFPGAGDLVPGSRVLAFLVHAEGHWWLTALAQSVFETGQLLKLPAALPAETVRTIDSKLKHSSSLAQFSLRFL